MKLLTKYTALILAIVLGLTVTSVSASRYYDVNDDSYYSEAIEALSTYGIVSGFAGNFQPDSYVTRAEFAKMMTLVSGLEDSIYSNSGNKRFDDVALTYWANGYINTAAQNKLIMGYPNGQFMPDRKVTFAEAITVLLRVMDYSTTDLGDNWPFAYMIKAKELGFTDDINLNDNDYITRGDLAVVINRALQTTLNGSTKKLISKMDIDLTNEVLIISTKNEDASLQADEIKTDAGVYKLAVPDLKLTPFSKAELVLNDDGEVINYNITYMPKRVVATIDSVADGVVYFENGTSSRSLGVSDSTSVYYDGEITSYGNIKNNIDEGSAVCVIYDKNGSVGYLLFGSADYTEAVVVKDDIYEALKTVGVTKEEVDNAVIVRNGERSTLATVQRYDVAYYLRDNSTIYLYSDKISGVYNEAFPNKANISSVDISGNRFDLETRSAVYKLGDKPGSYKLKSRVTVLLGKDGKIVDVVDINTASVSNYGILLSCGSEMSDSVTESGKQYQYINILNGEGKNVKYKTKTNYSNQIGDVGKISFDDDGNAVFSSVITETSVVKGKVDKNNRTIGDRSLAQDCVILERTYQPETKNGTATAKEIEFEEITSSELSAKKVLYAVTSGDFGDISLLIVENVTNSQYVYGVLTSKNTNISPTLANGSYTVFANGKTMTYSANFAANINNGSAVAMIVDGGEVVSLKGLNAVAVGTALNAIDSTRVKVGNKIYSIASDVQIIKKNSSGGGYLGMSIYDKESLIGKTVNLYADAPISQGGVIRIIIVN